VFPWPCVVSAECLFGAPQDNLFWFLVEALGFKTEPCFAVFSPTTRCLSGVFALDQMTPCDAPSLVS